MSWSQYRQYGDGWSNSHTWHRNITRIHKIWVFTIRFEFNATHVLKMTSMFLNVNWPIEMGSGWLDHWNTSIRLCLSRSSKHIYSVYCRWASTPFIYAAIFCCITIRAGLWFASIRSLTQLKLVKYTPA